jgi:hypothetical protein
VVLEANGTVWLYGVGALGRPNPLFLAPELARGEAATPRTDQWGLGALGLALVLGHPPWRSDDPWAEAVTGDLTRVVEAVARQWPALGHVLTRMVASEPADRFPTLELATDALADLATLAGPSEREALGTDLAGVPPPPLIPDDGAGGAPTAVPASEADDRPSEPWGDRDPDDTEDTDDRVFDDLEAFRSTSARDDDDDDGHDDDEDDAELRPELTDPIGWFQTPTPPPAPAHRGSQGSHRSSTDQDAPHHEISLAADPPTPLPSPTAHLRIVRLAPLLAGAMVVLLLVWLVVRVL